MKATPWEFLAIYQSLCLLCSTLQDSLHKDISFTTRYHQLSNPPFHLSDSIALPEKHSKDGTTYFSSFFLIKENPLPMHYYFLLLVL